MARLFLHRRDFRKLVAHSNSALTTSRFLRLTGLGVVSMALNTMLAIATPDGVLSGSGQYIDYSWSTIHSEVRQHVCEALDQANDSHVLVHYISHYASTNWHASPQRLGGHHWWHSSTNLLWLRQRSSILLCCFGTLLGPHHGPGSLKEIRLQEQQGAEWRSKRWCFSHCLRKLLVR